MSDANRSLSEYWDNLTSSIPFEKLGIGTNKRPPEDQLVSNFVRDVIIYITYVGLCNGIALCGVVANILNIFVYWKQGFKESINVSFASLSVCDLCVLVLFLWAGVCLAPGFARYSDNTAFVSELHLVVGGSQRMTFIRLSVWINAFIAIERCIAILRPHKVKTYFTPTRSVLVIAATFVLVSASALPVYSSVQLKTGFSRLTNSSRLMLSFTSSHREMRNISTISAAALQLLSLLVVLISNSFLAVALRKRSRLWDTNIVATTSSATRSLSLEPGPSQSHSLNPHQDQLISCTNWCLGSNRRMMPDVLEAADTDPNIYTVNHRNLTVYPNGLLAVPASSLPSIKYPAFSNNTPASSSLYSSSSEHACINTSVNSTQALEPRQNSLTSPLSAQKPRLNLSSSGNVQNKKLGKMILILSGMSLATSIPSITLLLMVSIDAKFGLMSRYGNLTRILSCVIAVVQTLNATLNIVVYYRMSSRYRQTLQKIRSWWSKLRANRVAPDIGNSQSNLRSRRN